MTPSQFHAIPVKPTFARISAGAACFALTTLMAMSATAQIASGTTGIDATGNARSEMMACNTGATQQSRETCMTEVRNANAAKRAGKVDNANGEFSANALKRCDVFQGEDLIACRARVTGQGQVDGSVAGGGAIRQVETVTIPPGGSVLSVEPKTNGNLVVVPPAR
ncbi:hypothetical protein [Polaromonas sp. YR568]|uniref:hypothetical protein n=1 Tax=Polaromonas sp. YR568 TaxID=1855301 RepID=UPI003137D5C9